MQYLHVLIFVLGCSPSSNTVVKENTVQNDFVQMSQNFLTSLKNNESTDDYIGQLAQIDLEDMVSSLNTSEKKLAFWINIYNALVQHRLVNDPNLFDDRGAFFTNPWVDIAGIEMSFDDIEHGIIRNSRVKLGLGYIKSWFNPKWERELRNTTNDGRVHFALNCGAAACPPIAIYSHTKLDQQLDESSKLYLKSITVDNGNSIKTSPLFSWFRGDFGGKSGIKNFLVEKGIVGSVQDKSLEFLPYDWTLSTGNYVEL